MGPDAGCSGWDAGCGARAIRARPELDASAIVSARVLGRSACEAEGLPERGMSDAVRGKERTKGDFHGTFTEGLSEGWGIGLHRGGRRCGACGLQPQRRVSPNRREAGRGWRRRFGCGLRAGQLRPGDGHPHHRHRLCRPGGGHGPGACGQEDRARREAADDGRRLGRLVLLHVRQRHAAAA